MLTRLLKVFQMVVNYLAELFSKINQHMQTMLDQLVPHMFLIQG